MDDLPAGRQVLVLTTPHMVMKQRLFQGRRRVAAAPTPPASERGAVTAELALVIPALVFVTAALGWLLSLVVAAGRLDMAAREGARSAARGDDRGQVVTAVTRVAPRAEVAITYSLETVEVSASEVRTPVLRGLSFFSRHLRASAVAAREPL